MMRRRVDAWDGDRVAVGLPEGVEIRRDWNPGQHPRNPVGEFAHSHGGVSDVTEHLGPEHQMPPVKRRGSYYVAKNWYDSTDYRTGRKSSMIGQPADFHAGVTEEPVPGTPWNSNAKQYSWRVHRQRTEREGPDARGQHWTGNYETGVEPTMAKAKSAALKSLHKHRSKHLAEGGDAGYPDRVYRSEDLAGDDPVRVYTLPSGLTVTHIARAFKPSELRDPHGRWSVGSGGHVTYHGNMGLDRADMPQLSGTVRGTYQPSSVMHPKFLDFLKGQHVKAERTRVSPESLKPTQTTGEMDAIRGIANDLLAGSKADTKPIVVSSDGRVLDGHHNWAGAVLANRERARKGEPQQDMPVIRVDAPMDRLMELAREFGRREGIGQRKPGEFANPKYAARFDVNERRDAKGKWTKGGAAGIAKTIGHRPGGGGYIAEQLKHSPTRQANLGHAGGTDSLDKYTVGGKLTPERQALHDRIVADLLAGHHSQAHPRATFLGGGSASGKSTVFGSGAGLPKDAVLIDADEVKSKLPEYNQMLKAGDPRAAAYVHEESSALSKRVMAEAMGKKFHFTLDGTGDGSADNMMGKIEQAKSHGYRVDGKYVSVDTETAVQRALARAKQTGRMVPEPVIREIHKGVSDTLAELVKRDGFDSLQLWDTGSAKPILVGEKPNGGRWGVLDQSAWQHFLNKRNE